MAIFFLVVGLELKRELVEGELNRFKTAALPFIAALGGMTVPATLFLLIAGGSAGSNGWAIPMATDIAFAVGVLALLGRRIPSSVRLFLLTLAIVDDIGAILIIALFYSGGVDSLPLLISGLLIMLVLLLERARALNLAVFVTIGFAIWLALDAAQLHASIAGAVVGLLAPLGRQRRPDSIARRLERRTIPVSTLIVIPVFALANTGIVLSLGGLLEPQVLPVASGIIVGLVAGKVIGVAGASWLMVRLGLAELPNGANWRHIVGVGFLAGIGFTVAIFVTDLAYSDDSLAAAAKLSIFIASCLSAGLGWLALRRSQTSPAVGRSEPDRP